MTVVAIGALRVNSMQEKDFFSYDVNQIYY